MRRSIVVLSAVLVVTVAAWSSWNTMPDLPRGYAPYEFVPAADDPAPELPPGAGFFRYRTPGMSQEDMIRQAVHANGRAKVVATLLFLVAVVSFPPYEVAALIPFFLFPVLMLTLGGIPSGFILRKILFVSPFALLIGIFNPFLDTRTAAVIAGFPVSAGWLSFVSILLRFMLTVTAALLLVATTGFNGVCLALEKLGAPKAFVVQLLFLYRYLFVLVDLSLIHISEPTRPY